MGFVFDTPTSFSWIFENDSKLSFVYELRHHPCVVTACGHGFTSYVLRTSCGVRSGVGLINKITGDSVIWRIVWVWVVSLDKLVKCCNTMYGWHVFRCLTLFICSETLFGTKWSVAAFLHCTGYCYWYQC